MRILLDECIDQRLARDLTGQEVKTVPQMGWAGKKNGELLRLAENEFKVFITIDRNLPAQQNVSARKLAVVVLRAKSGRLAELRGVIPELLLILPQLTAGRVAHVPENAS